MTDRERELEPWSGSYADSAARNEQRAAMPRPVGEVTEARREVGKTLELIEAECDRSDSYATAAGLAENIRFLLRPALAMQQASVPDDPLPEGWTEEDEVVFQDLYQAAYRHGARPPVRGKASVPNTDTSKASVPDELGPWGPLKPLNDLGKGVSGIPDDYCGINQVDEKDFTPLAGRATAWLYAREGGVDFDPLTDAEKQHWRNQGRELAAALAVPDDGGEVERLREALQAIMKVGGEINPSNYNHEDVCALNNAFIEQFQIAEAALASSQGSGR